jgi:hypothetical protein
MSRGWLVVKDQRSKRRSPMKAGGGAVRVESGAVRRLSVTVGGQGRRGGRKWGKRHGALAWTRRKRVKRGTTSGDAFCGGSAVRAERKRARGSARCRVGVGEGAERGPGSDVVA